MSFWVLNLPVKNTTPLSEGGREIFITAVKSELISVHCEVFSVSVSDAYIRTKHVQIALLKVYVPFMERIGASVDGEPVTSTVAFIAV